METSARSSRSAVISPITGLSGKPTYGAIALASSSPSLSLSVVMLWNAIAIGRSASTSNDATPGGLVCTSAARCEACESSASPDGNVPASGVQLGAIGSRSMTRPSPASP